jgi:starch synthase
VARATGGIHEIIEDFDPTMNRGYGFLCYEHSSEAFWDAIKRARNDYRDITVWGELMGRAMSREFSWTVAAERYHLVYAELVGDNQAAA